jgi:hypothetical protein
VRMPKVGSGKARGRRKIKRKQKRLERTAKIMPRKQMQQKRRSWFCVGFVPRSTMQRIVTWSRSWMPWRRWANHLLGSCRSWMLSWKRVWGLPNMRHLLDHQPLLTRLGRLDSHWQVSWLAFASQLNSQPRV